MESTTYTRVSRRWHKLKTTQGLFFGYSRQQVMEKAAAAHSEEYGMNDIDALNTFEKHGKAADFLLGAGKPEARESAEKRINAAVALYHMCPHLQDKLHDIALRFQRWNLMAAIEQRTYLASAENQRGARAC